MTAMNGASDDIDNKHAEGWGKAHIPKKLAAASGKLTSKKELLDALKSAVQSFVNGVYGEARTGNKHARICDLVMLRARSDIEELRTFDVDSACFKDAVQQALADAYEQSGSDHVLGDASHAVAAKLLELVGQDASILEKGSTLRSTASSKAPSALSATDIALQQVKRINDLVSSMTTQVNQQFAKLEQLVASWLGIADESQYSSDVVDAVERIRELQLGPVSLSSRGSRKRKKQKHADITVAGMTFSSKMVEALSSSAISSVIHSSIAVKQRNDDVISAFCIIELYVKENVKLTMEMLSQLSDTGFLSRMKKLVGKIMDFFSDRILKPLKTLFIDTLLVPMKAFLFDWAMSKIPDIVKKLAQVVNSFTSIAVKVFKTVRRVFRNVARRVKKWFRKVLWNMFITPIKIMSRLFIGTLRFLWKMIWGAIKLFAKGVWWGVRRLGSLARSAWQRFARSKLGQKLSQIGHKIANPFRRLGGWVKGKYNAVKNGISKFGQGVSQGIRNFGKMIGRGASRIVNGAWNMVSSLVSGLKRMLFNVVKSVASMIARGVNKLLMGLPGRFITLARSQIAKFMSRRALKKSGDGLVSKFFRWIGSKLSKMFSKMSLGRIMKGAADVISKIGKFGVKALPIVGWYLMARDIAGLMVECDNDWIKNKMRLAHISYEDKFWFEKLLGVFILDFFYTLLTDPMEILRAVGRLIDWIGGKMAKLFEAAHNSSLETESRKELYKEYQLRHTLYSKSSTPFNTCKIPSLAHIGDVDKEFDFIHGKLRGAVSIFNGLKSTLNNIFDAYNMMLNDDETYGNPVDEYWQSQVWFSKQVTSLLEMLMPTGIDNFTRGDLQRLVKTNVDQEDLMLIYHEVMATLDFLDYRNNRAAIQKAMQEKLSQLKAEHRSFYIDMDKLQQMCAEQASANEKFYQAAKALKDSIVRKGNELSQVFRDMDENGELSDSDSESTEDDSEYAQIMSQASLF